MHWRPPPLTLTAKEAEELDAIEFESKAKTIRDRWNALAEKRGATRFEDLTQGQQTVLFSRTYQHGPGWMEKKTYAQFLEQALSGNWGNGEAQCPCVKNYERGQTIFCTENACCTYFDIATKSDYKKRMLLEAKDHLQN
jgi:GH24 family phage-related lysozyme (muramidase)